MIIKKVDNKEEANYCDKLLSLLIQDEKKYNENIKDDYIVSNWYQNLYDKKNNALFIVLDNNSIVGYIYVKIITSDNGPEKEQEASISGLYVISEYRRKGIATSLIKEVKKWCLKKDIKYINLSVLSKNEAALNLYNKESFNEHIKRLRCEL